jgi:acyl-CoA synthetase (AMP-forming)/AMP-acid ligase II
MYGQTECARISYLPPEDIDRKPGSIGIPIPNTEFWVVDEGGERAAPQHVGELVVRGAHVMRGYWERPELTAAKLREGPIPGERVLYTGDLCRMDEEGYLYFVSRMDDIIKSRGEKVSPKEIENVLYALEGISMAAVVGVPDPVLGQAVKAIVTCKEGFKLTVQDVQRHCASHLEDLMVPKIIEFRDEMPRTPAGKIDKRRLATEGDTG